MTNVDLTTSRNCALLALSRIEAFSGGMLAPWSAVDETILHSQSARLLSRQTDAAAILGRDAPSLVRGIALVPFLELGGPFGPAWAGHPFASPAMSVGYRLREPDITRGLEALMGPAAGPKGSRRAVSFLRHLTELAGATSVREAITDQTRPTVVAEHRVLPPRRRLPPHGPTPASAATRIDLLFEWPIGADGRRAVVVVEAKLGAAVGDNQLRPYRQEALRRAKGGPVTTILLTAWADRAEGRHSSWPAVRWFSLLRRWEATLAAAGDADPEFARVRAHLWHFVLSTRKAHR